MRMLGILLIMAGVVLGGFAAQMKTTVRTEGRDFGYGISIPSVTVNNIGLMEERRNKLMLSGLLIVVGTIFTAVGSRSKSIVSANDSGYGYVKCFYCAELIKKEAILCKHCGKDVPQKTAPENPLHEPARIYTLAFDYSNCTVCPICSTKMRLDTSELQANQFKCSECNSEINFSREVS